MFRFVRVRFLALRQFERFDLGGEVTFLKVDEPREIAGRPLAQQRDENTGSPVPRPLGVFAVGVHDLFQQPLDPRQLGPGGLV